MKTLTVKEALSQGYTHCGHASKEWQSLYKISELDQVDFENDHFVLATQNPRTFTFNKHQIKELLIDVISDCEADETGRDDDQLYNDLKSLDCSEIAKQVETILKRNKTWGITEIKLIP